MFVTMLRRLSASRWLLAPHVLRPSRHTVSVYSSIDKHRTNPILGRNTVKMLFRPRIISLCNDVRIKVSKYQ